jgi:hypothetical protein
MQPSASLFLAVLCVPCLGSCAGSCTKQDKLTGTWSDDFNRAELGSDWNNTGGPYRIDNGALVFQMAHNHPLWLVKSLPDNVQIDVDCTARSADGDVKVVLAGDGKSFESDDGVRRDIQYTESGYVFIFGGWHNTTSALVKQQEHEWQRNPSVPHRSSPPVVPGHTYHFTIIRRGGHIEWNIDGQQFLVRDDPSPLAGPGHDHFAFTGWESQAIYDNLKIQAL